MITNSRASGWLNYEPPFAIVTKKKLSDGEESPRSSKSAVDDIHRRFSTHHG
jgi:hypothetical protein